MDPLPLLPGLCSSQATWDNYVTSLNHAMDLTIQVINEELDEELELPGIPPIPLPKSPDIRLPEMLPWERNLRLQGTPVPTGYVGNVFPLRTNQKQVTGKLTFPGIPEVLIGGPNPGIVPGVDPSVYVITLLNQNLQLMFDFLIEQGIEVEPIVIPYLDLCGEDASGVPGGAGASPGQIIVNQLVQQNLNNAVNGLIVVCELGDFQPFTDFENPGPGSPGTSAWNVNLGGGGGALGTFSPAARSFEATHVGSGGDVDNFETGAGDFYDPDRQPISCGHGFELRYTWSVSCIGDTGPGTIPQFFFDLYEILEDNSRIVRYSASSGSSGSAIPTFSPGLFASTSTIGLDIAWNFVGWTDGTVTANFEMDPIVDLGP